MTKLKISPTLALPLDFVTSTQAILAKKGKGKTYKAAVQAEELLDAHQQIVAIDPTGAWWGLRSSADGKTAGYPVTIFGGEHADLPLETTAGEVIASAIADEHFSAIIDLSLFRKGEALRFMAAFMETLYRKNRHALHLFIDEADVVAPQKTFSPEQARALGATDDLVRRGRIRGIGCTLITQRPQVLNKDVLSQIDMLTALGMNHPKDIGAIKDWVAVHGDEANAKQMIADLPALPVGEAWVWAPAADIFKRVTFRDRKTFDSGKTPKAGERRVVPKVLAKVDLERLGEHIKATAERAKADDPKTLKAKIADLEKQLAKKGAAVPQKVVEHIIEKPIASKAMMIAVERSLERGDKVAQQAQSLIERAGEMMTKAAEMIAASSLRFEAECTKLRSAFANATSATVAATNSSGNRPVRTGVTSDAKSAPRVPDGRPTLTRQVSAQHITPTNGALPVGESAVLRALIQYPEGLRREQLTVLTGYKRSTRDTYIQRLRERNYCQPIGDLIRVTGEGMEAMPSAEPLPIGEELQEWWLPRLPIGERAILEQLIARYPEGAARDELTEKTGYQRSTRDTYLQRLGAKQLVIDLGRGSVKASDTLFGVG